MGHLSTMIAGKLLDTVLPMLATGLGAIAAGVLARYMRKLGLEVDAKREAQLTELATKAVLAVEEQARRTPMGPDVKRVRAETIVHQATNDTIAPSRVKLAVDAAVPLVRAKLTPSTPATFGKQP